MRFLWSQEVFVLITKILCVRERSLLTVARFVTLVCALWGESSPIVSVRPSVCQSSAAEVGLLDQCGRCAGGLILAAVGFPWCSKFCCCSTTIKPLRNRAALPAGGFTRSCSCIIEVTVMKAASRQLLFVELTRSEFLLSQVWYISAGCEQQFDPGALPFPH